MPLELKSAGTLRNSSQGSRIEDRVGVREYQELVGEDERVEGEELLGAVRPARRPASATRSHRRRRSPLT